jgi:hypothetical protein
MLYIKVVDGQPIDHPIYFDNLFAVFPEFETSGVSSDYAVFQRISKPKGKPYKVIEHSYGWVDGVVQDIWTYRNMTTEELNARPCIYIDKNNIGLPVTEEEIRNLNPEIPEGLTGINFPAPLNYEKVLEVDRPEEDGTLAQYIIQKPPIQINGIWIQQWELKTRTSAEIAKVEKILARMTSSQQGTP